MGQDDEEAWIDDLEIRMAERIAEGDPDVVPAALATVLTSGIIRKLSEELNKQGLSLGEVLDLMSKTQAEFGALEARLGQGKGGSRGTADVTLAIEGLECAAAIRKLRLGGFTAPQVATMLNMPCDLVEAYYTKYQINPETTRILALHRQGVAGQHIADQLGIPKQTVFRNLRGVGLEPIGLRRRLTEQEKAAVKGLAASGKMPAEIADETGIPLHIVASTLRRAFTAKVPA